MSVMQPRHYATEELLRDGGSLCIRAIRPDDQERLLALFEGLRSRSVYFRFFQAKRRLTDDELQAFTDLDFVRHVALVATLREKDAESIIGVGRYSGLQEHGQPVPRAEVAFEVVEAHQGRGIGTLLLEHLARLAREQGIQTFEAYVLGENNRMLQVFDTSGFVVERSLENGVFHIAFLTAETPQVRASGIHRERQAASQSIRGFLQPRAVAVVGASSRPGSVGAALLSNLKRGGFTGPMYPIHPHAVETDGLPAFPHIRAIGAPVDLVLIAVPPPPLQTSSPSAPKLGGMVSW